MTKRTISAEMQEPSREMSVFLPPQCSDKVAEFLSTRSVYGFSMGEVHDSGREVYAKLRRMLQVEQATKPSRRMKEVKPCSAAAQ